MSYRPSGATSTKRSRRWRTEQSAPFDLNAFLARLARMSPEQRVEAYRYRFTERQRAVWVARYPDEVPLVNGEYEHIAYRLPSGRA